MRTTLQRGLVALFLLAASLLAVGATTTAPAAADECYTWSRTLSSGASGSDVAELQIRVAGWAGYGVNMAIDGSYGPQTTAAVRGFQAAYGLSADGVGGSPSFCTIASNARYAGFGGLFGPGYPGHDDHTHVDIRSGQTWSAPSCGI